MPDHVHLFVSAPPKFAPSEVVRLFKGITSRRLKQEFHGSAESGVPTGESTRPFGQKVTMSVPPVMSAQKLSDTTSKRAKRNNFKY